MSDLSFKWRRVVSPGEEPLIRWIDLANGTMFRLICFRCFYPRPGIFVGIERKGCWIFNPEIEMHFNYVGEKLNLIGSDAMNLTDFINAQLFDDYRQQGEYNPDYAEEAMKPYVYQGEHTTVPLTPEILKKLSPEIVKE